ncbi:MAG: rane protein in aromatic hydrocarbon degradation [Myxococcaceae bacterium]|nr:rane protein in aromatic hydrocarbon degradation [Myxococcaceae bacterium]
MSKTSSLVVRLAGALVAFVILLPCAEVHAGGLYLFDRGARALGMGGAFIASPDDPSALWYNPAGLIESKNQVVADAVLPILIGDFQRQYSDGTYAPKIKARPTPIPIPTLAFSHMLGDKLAIGAGIMTPQLFEINWENSVRNPVTGQRDPPPTRYSLIGLRGTVLANPTAGIAWAPIKAIQIGFDVQVPVGYFRAETALTACDGVICSFPEQKDFDARATIKTIPTYGITGVAGIVLNLDAVRFGFSAMLPYTLHGNGKVNVKLPTNVVFENANVSGKDASLDIKFPLILRGAGQMRPLPYLRMEGAVVWEQWSTQKTIDINLKNTTINNVTGLGNYDVGNIKLQRDMKNTWSLRGGFELTLPKKWFVVDIDLQLRGGLAYETGAFDKKTLSPLTLDTNKVILSGGLTVGLLSWLRFDTVAGMIFMQNVEVTDGAIRQPQAIRPPQQRFPTVINNGKYAQNAFFLGGGFRVLLGKDTFREPVIRKKRQRNIEDEAPPELDQEMPTLNEEEDESADATKASPDAPKSLAAL